MILKNGGDYEMSYIVKLLMRSFLLSEDRLIFTYDFDFTESSHENFMKTSVNNY